MADNEEKTPVSPIPRRTIRLKTINSGAAAPAAPAKTPAPDAGVRTIKLVPQTEERVPAAEPTVAGMSNADKPISTDTSRLSRKTIRMTTPGVQFNAAAPASPTVKLEEPAQPAAAPAAPTIKLNNPAQPAAPTIKLGNPAQTAATPAAPEMNTDTAKIPRQSAAATQTGSSAPTMKLNTRTTAARPGISTATIKLSTGNTQFRQTAAASTIKLNRTAIMKEAGEQAAAAETASAPAKPAPAIQPEVMKDIPMPAPVKAAEASLAMVISSAVALVAVGFLCFMLFAQYSNFYNGSNIAVPGTTQKTVK